MSHVAELGTEDLNLHYQSQNLACCHYTSPQSIGWRVASPAAPQYRRAAPSNQSISGSVADRFRPLRDRAYVRWVGWRAG